ncbi:MAG TPA: CAP domain-containing protein [Planctomycetota bacterium]|nr:CAP domain-containing protein [Planctomycetota bacterium]
MIHRSILFLAILFSGITFGAEKKPAAPPPNSIDAGLAAWNAVREAIGVPPVKRDPKLEEMAMKHIDYMKATKTLTHHQDKEHPKYTEDGDKSGRGSCLGQGLNRPVDAIMNQLNCFLHRIPLIQPDLENVSFCLDGGFAAFDYRNGARREYEWKGPIAYPADKATDFAPSWSGREGPCPIPGGPPRGAVGQPVTLTFAPNDKVTDGKITLTEGKNAVDGWVSSPDKPAVEMFSDNLQTICFIAKQPLKPKTAYTVKVTATVNEKPFEKTWTFTTSSGGRTR